MTSCRFAHPMAWMRMSNAISSPSSRLPWAGSSCAGGDGSADRPSSLKTAGSGSISSVRAVHEALCATSRVAASMPTTPFSFGMKTQTPALVAALVNGPLSRVTKRPGYPPRALSAPTTRTSLAATLCKKRATPRGNENWPKPTLSLHR